jgi:hydroxymethylbilane synthase
VTEVLDPLQVLPAPAQGALAIECRASDAEALSLLAVLDDPDSRAAVAAERALLAALEAGCSAPVGALAEIAEGDDGPEIFLRGSVTALDGSDAVRLSATGPTTDAEGVGQRLAAELIAIGADQIMESST